MIMFIWQRLLKIIRHTRRQQLTFRLEPETFNALTILASEEHRSVEETATNLLRIALTQRQEADIYLGRWQDLSPREKQVAALVCLDYTNREIARRLIISPETVKSHIRNVLGKTGLRSKAELRQSLANWDFHEWLGISS
ncbi:MAG: LuxR family transcriptional regulator [Anaerolineales bacterium]|nr:LuxR family transcriptional regulator [Anaerolineales bacterium]HEY61740.1 LuxR family transcriptional regulator [Anaerolineae bacterium]